MVNYFEQEYQVVPDFRELHFWVIKCFSQKMIQVQADFMLLLKQEGLGSE
jgi:hypothetical protein